MDQMPKNDPRTILGWAMYDWANSAYITTLGAVVAAFFTGTIVPEGGFAGLRGETLWGAMVGWGSLLLFLAMPVLGAVADYASAKRRLLRAFAWTGALTTILLPFVPDGAVVMFLVVALITQFGFVAANVFYDGFLPLITTDDTIDRVSSRGFAYGYFGGGLYLLLGLVLILLSGDDGATGLSAATAARIVIGGSGAWWFLFSLITLRRLPPEGEPRPLPEGVEGKPGWMSYARIGFGEAWSTTRKLRGFPALLTFVAAYFVYNNGINTVINVSGAYAEDTLNLAAEEIIITFLIVQFVAFGGALLFGWLAGLMGTKPAIVSSLIIWTLITIAGFLLPAEQPVLLYVLAVFIGLVLGGSQALSRSLYGSMIPEESSAEFYGFFTVFSKGSAVIGAFAFTIISAITGSGRPAILSIIFFFVVGLVLLLLVNVEEGRASRDDWAVAGAKDVEL